MAVGLRRAVRARRRARAGRPHRAARARDRRALARHRRRHLHLHQPEPRHRRAVDGLTMETMTPREIVQELDKHIVGQNAAKRSVAIALRNRWRRMQVVEPLRQEITPKNILMIGPTGVGKTEIARRLAKLARAPFIKVEATKFTEVGYVGREVDSIVKELVDVAVKQTREEEMAKVRPRATDAAEERILDALLPKLSERRRNPPEVPQDAARGRARRARDRDRAARRAGRPRDHGPARHGGDDAAAPAGVPGHGRRPHQDAQAAHPRGAQGAHRRGSGAAWSTRKSSRPARSRTPSRTASSSSTRSTRSAAAPRPWAPTSRAKACSATSCRWSRAAPSAPSTAWSRPTTCCSSPRAPSTWRSPRT